MMKINVLDFNISTEIPTDLIHGRKKVIATINPHSYVVSKSDYLFNKALRQADYLLPDGVGFILATFIFKFKKIKRITGSDLHFILLKDLNESKGKVFYLGSTNSTLDKIRLRIENEYPDIRFFS